MKNCIGLLLLRSCVFIERGGTKCEGIRNKFDGGKKTADGICPHYRAGLEVGCRTDRTRQDSALPILADCGESVLRQSNRHGKPHQKAVAEVSLRE